MSQVVKPAVWDHDRPFEVQGHRGACGLRPENSLAGIACALEIGVASIECDVALSVDGAVILSHDGTVPWPVSADTNSPSSMAVGRLRLAELRRLDLAQLGRPERRELGPFRGEPGQRIPTLGAVLALFQLFEASTVRLDVEIKSARHSDPQWDAAHVVERVIDVIRAHGALQMCSLRSFDMQVLQEALRQCEDLPRVLLVGTLADGAPAELALDPGTRSEEITDLADHVAAAAVAPGRSLVTRELVEQAHRRGWAVIPWTVNDPATVQRLLSIGVDGICTDRPDVVRTTVADAGFMLPPRHRAPDWLGYGWEAWPEQSRNADAS